MQHLLNRRISDNDVTSGDKAFLRTTTALNTVHSFEKLASNSRVVCVVATSQ